MTLLKVCHNHANENLPNQREIIMLNAAALTMAEGRIKKDGSVKQLFIFVTKCTKVKQQREAQGVVQWIAAVGGWNDIREVQTKDLVF